MKAILLFLVSLFSLASFAQKSAEFNTKNPSETIHKKDTIKVVDTTKVVVGKKLHDAQVTVLQIVVKDSVIVPIVDDPLAAEIDSLWKKELLNSDLFENMSKMVHDDFPEEIITIIPTDTLKARLADLNARTPFNVEYNPVLEKVIQSYLGRNKKSMERLMALSTYYFPMFEKELDKYDIPLEIKYLAIVESALNPRAKSRVGATGLWQFMYPTGKMHGLDVSSYVDERMDPIRSTEAACKYLSRLYGVFGDWDLVLASYNSGPGNVSKAIRRSGGRTNYWNLRPFLPRETAGYVPAFLATYYLFEYANEHGFNPQLPKLTYFETDTVHLRQMLSFDQISEVTGVEKDLIQFLNPSYKLDIIPKIEREPYSLRLPKSKIGLFVNNEENIYLFAEAQRAKEEKPNPQYFDTESQTRYRVKKGDYLGKIAAQHGVRVSEIKRWNSLKNNNLRIGQRLVIYSRGSNGLASGNNSAGAPKMYTVKQGDSLWSISRKFPGVTVQNIQKWNDIRGSSLKPGMKLKLSKG